MKGLIAVYCLGAAFGPIGNVGAGAWSNMHGARSMVESAVAINQ